MKCIEETILGNVHDRTFSPYSLQVCLVEETNKRKNLSLRKDLNNNQLMNVADRALGVVGVSYLTVIFSRSQRLQIDYGKTSTSNHMQRTFQ